MPTFDQQKVHWTNKTEALYQKFKFGNIKQVDRLEIFPPQRISQETPWNNVVDAPVVVETLAQKLFRQEAKKSPKKPVVVKKPVEKLTKKPKKEKEVLWSSFVDSPKVVIKPRGLVNNGNMCFMNSILQPLVHLEPFYNLINAMTPSKDLILLIALQEFIQEFRHETEKEESPFKPEYVYDAIKKRSKLETLKGRQEDAQEFLGFLLDGLHEELLTMNQDQWHHIGKGVKTNVQKTSRLTEIVGGTLKQILKTGPKESIQLEPFQIFSLDVTNIDSIDSSILKIMTVEIIDDFNSKHNHETTKQTLFEQTPPVLIISMKRFIYDVEQNQTQKVVKHITITEDLCLPSVVMTNNQKVDYKLFAVVNHHGKKAQGGHYTVDVFCNDTEWYRFDDTDVGKIELDQVLKEESDRQPYLLFYTLKE